MLSIASSFYLHFLIQRLYLWGKHAGTKTFNETFICLTKLEPLSFVCRSISCFDVNVFKFMFSLSVLVTT